MRLKARRSTSSIGVTSVVHGAHRTRLRENATKQNYFFRQYRELRRARHITLNAVEQRANPKITRARQQAGSARLERPFKLDERHPHRVRDQLRHLSRESSQSIAACLGIARAF